MKLKVPDSVGMPEIVPVKESRESPSGSSPESIAPVVGGYAADGIDSVVVFFARFCFGQRIG